MYIMVHLKQLKKNPKLLQHIRLMANEGTPSGDPGHPLAQSNVLVSFSQCTRLYPKVPHLHFKMAYLLLKPPHLSKS